MNAAAFQPGHPGRLVQIATDGRSVCAYVPAPLPPVFPWTGEIVTALSAADRALGQLAGVGRNLPNPHLLIGPFKRREAVLSSRIEGTQASLSDLLLFEAAPVGEPAVGDVLEVVNYVRALDYGLARQRILPMSQRLLCEMHGRLLEGVRGQNQAIGEFRRSQNWIGPAGRPIDEAVFVPPPVNEMTGCLAAFEKFLHAKSELPTLVRLAAVHYQFEAIHPFYDGNGRIGRLLVTLLLCIEGVLPEPLLYLSAYLERHRQQYYERLLGVSQRGEWREWFVFFLRGVAESAMDAVERAAKLSALREDYRRRLVGRRASAHPLALADQLFAHPAISVPQAAKLLGVTQRAAQLNIDKLVAAKIVQEVTGRKRNRVFLATEIVRAVE
ncbi:MAG: Fic family protein [Planctomycetaceae bacterium]|nr:Fic family protein [Planctomycetaceae bacterium]